MYHKGALVQTVVLDCQSLSIPITNATRILMATNDNK